LPYGRQEAGKPLQMSAMGKFLRIAVLFGLMLYLYIFQMINIEAILFLLNTGGLQALYELYPVKLMLFGCFSLLLIGFYNNKRGRAQRWLFYLAYPLHLFILGIIRFLYIFPKVYN